jgi:glyoxylase-like metal-dependent hydrolase (beta-lactamase superfamily II)
MLESQLKEVKDLMDRTGLRVKHVVNTHGHADHIAGNRRLKELTRATILTHPLDAPKLTDASLNGSSLFGVAVVSPPADELLEDGDSVRFGQNVLGVIHTPGHTPGSISLLGDGYLFTGDILFFGSIGVVENPNGTPNPSADYSVEVNSIRERLLILPDNTRIFPGHGPFSTIGREREYNPFLT